MIHFHHLIHNINTSSFLNVLTTLFICIALSACGSHSHEEHDHEEHNHTAEGHHHKHDIHEHDGHHHDDDDDDDDDDLHTPSSHPAHNANTVEFHDEQAALIDFALDTCLAGRMTTTIKTVAQVLPAQKDEHVIVAPFAGIIHLESQTILGNIITPGQVIATTNSNGIEGSLHTRRIQAQAEAQRALQELQRKESLAKDNIVSLSDLEQARATYTATKAEADNLNSSSANGHNIIRATETEYIRHIYVQNGQMVSAGDPIVAVSHNMSHFLQAEVQPRYYRQLQNIVGANIKIDNQWHSLSDLNGRIVSCGRQTTTNSPLLPVTLEVNNNAILVTGTFVDVYLQTKGNDNMLSIPTSSLIEEMGDFFVFVKTADEHYEKREVHIGATDGFRTEIVSGLSQGEIVVSKGAVIIKLAMTSGALDAHSGHVH